MGVIVEFDYDVWVARYPEFAGVSEAAAQAYFDEATIYNRNDGGGPVPTAAVQSTLLNMLTAHIAARYATINGQVPSTLVGRISDASEGSVSVKADYAEATPGSMAWYIQTKYGADYWQASAPYRTMRYRPGPGTGGVVGGGWPYGGRSW